MNNIIHEHQKPLRVLSLFDGISCGMIALQRAGLNIESYDAFEIEPNAIAISKYNYHMIKHHGDVMNSDFTEYEGKVDLVIFGSPCTYWSSAKCSSTAKSKRELDTDGIGWKLFLQGVKAIQNAKPKHFLFENNYSMPDNIKDAITETLGVQPIMIDANLVSAQNRKRLYWTNIPVVGLPEDKHILNKDVVLDTNEYPELLKEFDSRIWNTIKYNDNYCKYDLSGKGYYSQQDRMYYLDGKAPTVPRCRTETKYNVLLDKEEGLYKKTHPIEIERLQTLPDDYTKYGIFIDNKSEDRLEYFKEVPKTRRFEAIGNGWCVDVIAFIFGFIE